MKLLTTNKRQLSVSGFGNGEDCKVLLYCSLMTRRALRRMNDIKSRPFRTATNGCDKWVSQVAPDMMPQFIRNAV
jgi:hypothetical protein